MAATLGVSSLAGCNNGGGHGHAYNWTTDYEATCVSPGQRTGKCVCGNVVAEVIPVDPDAHEFDTGWTVVPPTETQEGSATRTCKNNGSHTFGAILPKLTEEDEYLSVEVLKQPNILEEGSRRYVFAHSAGDVEFNIAIPKHGTVQGVEDVVVLAASLHGSVRSCEGNYVYGDPAGTDVSKHNFSSYYGDNYVRVHDDGNNNVDFWFSRDDEGKPFGISAELQTVITNPPEDPDNPPEGWAPVYGQVPREPRIYEDVTEEDLLGFGYASGGGIRMTYGAEDTLLTYYNASQSDGAIKYDGSYEAQPDGGYRCSFSFSRKEQIYFCRYYVEFTTYPTGAIKTLSVKTKIIRAFMLANTFNGTNIGEIVYDNDGDIIFGEIYPISTVTGAEEYEVEYERDANGDIVYNYTYLTDDDGRIIVDGEGNPVVATDNDGNEIKSPKIIGIKTYGYKQKPDGTLLLDDSGKEIARPVPLGWEEGAPLEFYYEEGGRKPDGSVYEEDHPFIAVRHVNFTQTLKVEGEKVEENPYPAESVYIRSFDVMYGGKPVDENTPVEIAANTLVKFGITNVQPADTAKLEFDPITVYLKTSSGEIELDYTGNVTDFNQNAYHIVGYFNRENNTVYVNAQYAGELTLVLRTESGKYSRELKLDIAKGVPSALTAQAYLYSDINGTVSYVWTDFEYKADDPETHITLYEGQSVYVRGTAIASEANYVDASFVTALESGDLTSPYITLEDGLELPDGTKVSKITAVSANPGSGAVGVYVNSVHKNGSRPVAYRLLGIKVVAAPSVDDMFTGSYKGRFTGIKMIESGSSRPADVTVTFKPQTNVTGTIEVEVSDGGNSVTCVYGYTYDEATRTFTCTFVSGREDETFRFEFALNEVYKITITHPTRTGRSETIVLSRPE